MLYVSVKTPCDMGMMLNVECGISCDGNASQGVLTDSFSKWDFIFPGTIVWSDNCTTAIRPPAKDALPGIRFSLADFRCGMKLFIYP